LWYTADGKDANKIADDDDGVIQCRDINESVDFGTV